VATGVKSNIDVLQGTGVKLDAGIIVDETMRSSVENIYAAGDCAQGLDFSTGAWEVHAVQPTAVDHGRIAALNMAGRSAPYKGSLNMNVLDTAGLISVSFGRWDGVEGGDHAESADPRNFRYMRLEFDGDRVVGALSLGHTDHVGVLRGLIQTGISLGSWKKKLMADPNRIVEAYIDRTQAA
jgi:NAD(P)H-nitrite reductase large subunit